VAAATAAITSSVSIVVLRSTVDGR
jgi:hypothetical protein